MREGKPERAEKEPLTVHISVDVVDRAKNAVYWTPGLTPKRGEPFPPRRSERERGRPLGSWMSMKRLVIIHKITGLIRLADTSRKANLPAGCVHVLRHTAAKLRRDVGESVESVSRLLDHSNLAVTTTYLRRLEGEEDTGWWKIAALLT